MPSARRRSLFAWFRWAALLVVLSICLSAAADDEKDSVDRDYTKELPRIKATEPGEVLRTFHVADGFRIELVAAEPLVTDPIAMAFDENGRLFVVEMRDYSEQDKEKLGRIRLLEDTDGDGHFDKSSIFAVGLSWPTAITCWDGGVFVGAAPDLYYLKDTNGDGKADVRKLVYTGFGRSNVQGLMNTFKWGLDNRIHGAASSSGASVRQAGDKEGKPLSIRGRDFAFDPRTLEIRATSGGGQHGLSFNQWGEKFVCSNSNHIQYVLFEDRYLARNPYLAAPSSRAMIAADGPQADVFRTSPVEPWRIVRTRLRVKGIVPGPVEGGGKAAGYFTGSTGITIYRGNAWPKEFYGWAIIGDVGSNLIHRKRLEPSGIKYIGRRVDEKSEFVSSRDVWFRPVQFANGPDGALYVADMYREVIEHPKSLPPVIKKHLDLTSGRERGRIYRIVPDGFKQPKLPRLGAATTAELVATLDHPNGWHRETAARLLYTRQDRRAVSPLDKLAVEADRPEGRIRALYALDGLNALSPDVVLARLSDEHPRVREHAVRLSERVAAESPAVREKLYSMTADDNLRVRYQLGFTLGELRGPQRNSALAKLLHRNPEDASIRLACLSSLARGAGSVLAELASDKQFRSSPAGRSILSALAKQIGREQRSGDTAAVVKVLAELPADEKQVVQAIVKGLAAKPGGPLHKQIAAATGGRVEELRKEMIKQAAAKLVDPKLDVTKRADAVRQLQFAEYDEVARLLTPALLPEQPTEIKLAAMDTLATFEDARVSAALLGAWKSFSPRERRRAGDILLLRPQWVSIFLGLLERGDISPVDLQPGRLQLLAAHSDTEIRRRARALLESIQKGGRSDVVAAYRSVLESKGDASHGKLAFKKHCAACHRLEGVGHDIAPNLAAMRNRGTEAILVNVLDPNREMNPEFQNYLLITKDGRSLTGLIAAETATSITLRRADDQTDTVLRIDIDELTSTGLSLMPEGLEKEIDKQTMADLIEYLKSIE